MQLWKLSNIMHIHTCINCWAIPIERDPLSFCHGRTVLAGLVPAGVCPEAAVSKPCLNCHASNWANDDATDPTVAVRTALSAFAVI